MWDVERVCEIKQFTDSLHRYMSLKSKFKNISFSFKSPSINLEVKYIFYQHIFRGEWNVYTAFKGVGQYLKLLITFINLWLNERGRSTTCKTKRYGKNLHG